MNILNKGDKLCCENGHVWAVVDRDISASEKTDSSSITLTATGKHPARGEHPGMCDICGGGRMPMMKTEHGVTWFPIVLGDDGIARLNGTTPVSELQPILETLNSIAPELIAAG